MSRSVVLDRTLARRYALEREIGRGGMGVVYRAHDLKYDRPVAVKFLSPDATGHLGAERFADEIRTTARLRHPNILQVDDSDEADGELFYVMPYVEGPSLRERLERGPRLTVLETLRIVRQASAALGYAHSHGIIHRDIKPDNILLGDDGHVYVADFGLAHVLSRSENARLTQVGLAIGTPAYMSPEQATCEPLDGRSDIYSLGCVLFEMLAGEPPFAGTDAAEMMRRQVTEAPPTLQRRRADVPPAVDRLVRRMLEKMPADRFPSATTLCEALDAEIAHLTAGTAGALEPQSALWTTRRLAIAVSVVALVGSLLWLILLPGAAADELEADRWLLLPLEWQGDAPAELRAAEDAQLYAAFGRWTDLDLVPRLRADEFVPPEDQAGGIPQDAALGFARELRAGRLLQGFATLVGDSIHLDLRVTNVADAATRVADLSMRLPASGGRADRYALVADSLLFGRIAWDGYRSSSPGTSSAAARRAYGEGRSRLELWEITAADSAFARALAVDPSYARPHFWSAQLAALRGDLGHERSIADALADSLALTPRERSLAAALAARTAGQFEEACAAYEAHTRATPRDFFGWYGLAECLRRDPLVVTDRTSPSGWRFRTSRHAAVNAYAHAFTMAPGSHRAFRDDGFTRVLSSLMAPTYSTQGFGADGMRFHAVLEVHGDTLVLVPRPWRIGDSAPLSDADRQREAGRRQAFLFQRIAESWAAAYPSSADALHALALAQDILADPAAVQTVDRARARARTDGARRDLAARAIWTGLKFNVLDEDALNEIRLLADSLLATHRPDGGPLDEGAAALALLLGRPARAAALERGAQPGVDDVYGLAAAVTRPGAALLVFAGAGGPVDSIARLEEQLLAALGHALPPEQRSAATHSLQRAALLAAPVRSMRVLEQRDLLTDATAIAWAALHAGDVATARRIAAGWREQRPGGVAPGGLSMDVLYSQAALHVALGDTAAAIRWLDPTLTQPEWMQPGVFDEAANVAALVRAFALRAELADRLGDRSTARRFASTVLALWSTGDPAVAPLLDRMRAIRQRNHAAR